MSFTCTKSCERVAAAPTHEARIGAAAASTESEVVMMLMLLFAGNRARTRENVARPGSVIFVSS